MYSTRLSLLVVVALLLFVVIGAFFIAEPMVTAQSNSITVQVDKPGATISSSMFGVFFEDINFAADGGIYPERIKNRNFEFTDALMGWKKFELANAKGSITIQEQEPLNSTTPHYLRIKVENAGEGLGVSNEGFRGIGVAQGASYNFSV